MNYNKSEYDEWNSRFGQALGAVRVAHPELAQHCMDAFAFAVAAVGFTDTWLGMTPPPLRARIGCFCANEGPIGLDDAIALLLDRDGPVLGPLGHLHAVCWINGICASEDPASYAPTKVARSQ